MLYLESPAGSGQDTGFSTCTRGGRIVGCCWDDKTQGVAYGHTLLAFLKAFPELATRDLYLAGETYFGQCKSSNGLARPSISPRGRLTQTTDRCCQQTAAWCPPR